MVTLHPLGVPVHPKQTTFAMLTKRRLIKSEIFIALGAYVQTTNCCSLMFVSTISTLLESFLFNRFYPLTSSGGSRIRTCEGMSQQIYSLSRLTASVSPRKIFSPYPAGKRASGGIRTHDRRFTKPLLCQLSYAGGDAKTSKYTETQHTRNTK